MRSFGPLRQSSKLRATMAPNTRSSTQIFPQFPLLPAELQLKIWNSVLPRPAIHCFDVCFPSPQGSFERSTRAFTAADGSIIDQSRYAAYKNTVFLDQLHSQTDPSVYKLAEALKRTCVDAANETAMGRSSPPRNARTDDVNSVYLPGKDQRIQYDNTTDVLWLRFGSPGAIADVSHQVLEGEHRVFSSGISDALEGIWSSELASTLQGARRIALGLSETWAATHVQEIYVEEISYLSCVLQRDLEVLYLIDEGFSQQSQGGEDEVSEKEAGETPPLTLDSAEREGDVIYGMGKTYREVRDLRQLGWEESHPSFVVCQILDETIRSQQGDKDTFRGVRVLVCEE